MQEFRAFFSKPVMSPEASKYHFGPYEVRTRTRELYKEGRKLKLRPQAFQVLTALAEGAGDVVTREQLRGRVWATDTFVDFEHGLNTAIKELRATLNDSAAEPRYIETLPKLGYRMVVAVEKEVEEVKEVKEVKEGTESEAEGRAAPDRVAVSARQGRWRRPAVVVAGLCGVALLGLWMQRDKDPGAPVTETPRVAVLPFENLTGDAEQEYFSDGLTEEMISQLGRINPQSLEVIGRASVMHYKHTQEPVAQIGNELGVQYVLEGSVRRDAARVRVNAELLRTKDQHRLWSSQYDRELSSLLELQAEIAQTAAGEIAETLNAPKPMDVRLAAGTSGERYEAYDLYLRGLYFWNKRSVVDFEKAIVFFQGAIEKDPNFAPAYAGLANSYSLLTGYSLSPGTLYMDKARAAAKRALELDANLPEGHTAMALVVQNYDWNWPEAEKEFRKAIEIDPNYATAHHWYGEHLGYRGRFEEAFVENEKARRLDPLSLIIQADYGMLLYYDKRYSEAEQQFLKILQAVPDFSRAGMIIEAQIAQGNHAEADEEIENRRKRNGGEGVWYWNEKARLYSHSGETEKAKRVLENLERLQKTEKMDPSVMFWGYLAAGDKENAFRWLKKAQEAHSNLMTTLKVDPLLDGIRGDPRFTAIVKKVGLE
jgi:TolB-like protein/DNA-binding winged helix-turn-helix (wHTH) protein/Tfp pilus assembly protein PilF